MSKPSLPEGVRDFSPEQVFKRNYLFDTIKDVFLKYGFLPIETPSMEKLSTLTGKYGEEGDRLLFKILNNGDFLAKANKEALIDMNSGKLVSSIADRGLRYDLTVPFARYVVMHQNDIAFPFKRFQIQPVWRADRAQRGRYREFYQCDVDVIGSESLMCEAELVRIYDEVFHKLGLNVVIKVNNRKILEGIAESVGAKAKFTDMTIAIDKLDKVGEEGVEKELLGRGFDAASVVKIMSVLGTKSLTELKDYLKDSEIGQKGIRELEDFHSYLDSSPLSNEVAFDITLARGLNYYTGCIFEVQSKDATMGSIGGGGRYDDLTGVFGMKGVSGVGVSLGAERIFDIMEELGKFPKAVKGQAELIFLAFDAESHKFAFTVVTALRKAGIRADIYPDAAKMQKQMTYANRRGFAYAAIIGENERLQGKIALKNMESGEQLLLSVDELIQKFKH